MPWAGTPFPLDQVAPNPHPAWPFQRFLAVAASEMQRLLLQWSPRLPWDLGAAELVWAQPLPCVMRRAWLVGHPPRWDWWERPDGSGSVGFSRGEVLLARITCFKEQRIKPCGVQTFFRCHEVLGDEDSWAGMFGQEGLCCPACPALAHPLCLGLSH